MEDDTLYLIGDRRSDLNEIVEETLGWCNDRRYERGMEPLDDLPKGKRGDPRSCPCGKATGLMVRATVYEEPSPKDDGSYNFAGYLPERVQLFTQQFDGGYLPEYDLEEAV